VNALVLRVAVVVLAFALPSWIVLSLFVVLGRVRYDRIRREPTDVLSSREAERLVRRMSRRPKTEWGRWRRVTALARLEQARHPAVPRLVRPMLADPDPRIAAAAIRTLGDIGDEWAIDLLISELRTRDGSRSRIAAELERLRSSNEMEGPAARR